MAWGLTHVTSVEVQVRQQSVKSALAAHAGFLVAAEGARWVELVVGVGPEDAGADFGGDLEDLGALVGPDAAGQSIGRVVGFFDGLGDGPKGLDGQDRAE